MQTVTVPEKLMFATALQITTGTDSRLRRRRKCKPEQFHVCDRVANANRNSFTFATASQIQTEAVSRLRPRRKCKPKQFFVCVFVCKCKPEQIHVCDVVADEIFFHLCNAANSAEVKFNNVIPAFAGICNADARNPNGIANTAQREGNLQTPSVVKKYQF